MLTPSPAELLGGVADALAATVLPELAPGPARRQVQAAIGICRRVAGALPNWAPQLVEETRDLAATLGRLTPGGRWSAAAPDLADAVAAADELPPGRLPSLDELAARDRRLQEALARMVGAVVGGRAGAEHQLDESQLEAEAELRALLSRLVARQLTLGLSPWEG